MKYFKKYKIGGQIERKERKERKETKIIPTKELRTFDFGGWAGKKQTDERNKTIHETIIFEPSKEMTSEKNGSES